MLDSRGGRFNEKIFQREDVEERIRSLFTVLRTTKYRGLFMTMQTSPDVKLEEIEQAYGPADFVQSSAELARVYDRSEDDDQQLLRITMITLAFGG